MSSFNPCWISEGHGRAQPGRHLHALNEQPVAHVAMKWHAVLILLSPSMTANSPSTNSAACNLVIARLTLLIQIWKTLSSARYISGGTWDLLLQSWKRMQPVTWRWGADSSMGLLDPMSRHFFVSEAWQEITQTVTKDYYEWRADLLWQKDTRSQLANNTTPKKHETEWQATLVTVTDMTRASEQIPFIQNPHVCHRTKILAFCSSAQRLVSFISFCKQEWKGAFVRKMTAIFAGICEKLSRDDCGVPLVTLSDHPKKGASDTRASLRQILKYCRGVASEVVK